MNGYTKVFRLNYQTGLEITADAAERLAAMAHALNMMLNGPREGIVMSRWQGTIEGIEIVALKDAHPAWPLGIPEPEKRGAVTSIAALDRAPEVRIIPTYREGLALWVDDMQFPIGWLLSYFGNPTIAVRVSNSGTSYRLLVDVGGYLIEQEMSTGVFWPFESEQQYVHRLAKAIGCNQIVTDLSNWMPDDTIR